MSGSKAFGDDPAPVPQDARVPIFQRESWTATVTVHLTFWERIKVLLGGKVVLGYDHDVEVRCYPTLPPFNLVNSNVTFNSKEIV